MSGPISQSEELPKYLHLRSDDGCGGGHLERLSCAFPEGQIPDGHRFMQDNDPKHTSRLAKDYIKEQNVNWWCTPASSTDINPI